MRGGSNSQLNTTTKKTLPGPGERALARREKKLAERAAKAEVERVAAERSAAERAKAEVERVAAERSVAEKRLAEASSSDQLIEASYSNSNSNTVVSQPTRFKQVSSLGRKKRKNSKKKKKVSK